MKLSLSKHERLKSKTQIDKLFEDGKSFNVFPIKVVYSKLTLQDNSVPVKIAVTVSKRNFKRAVDRNLIKRRMREAYRLNKTPFYLQLEDSKSVFVVMFIYIAKEILDYQTIEKSCKTILQRLIRIDVSDQ